MSYTAEVDTYLYGAPVHSQGVKPSTNHIITCDEKLASLFDSIQVNGENSVASLELKLHWQAIAAGFGQASETLEPDSSHGAEKIIHFTAK